MYENDDLLYLAQLMQVRNSQTDLNRNYLIIGLVIGIGAQVILTAINTIICCFILKSKDRKSRYFGKTEDVSTDHGKGKKRNMSS